MGRNYLLKHVIEGKIEGKVQGMERPRRRRKQLLDGLKESILYNERGSIRSCPAENSLWKGLCTCRKADDGVNVMELNEMR